MTTKTFDYRLAALAAFIAAGLIPLLWLTEFSFAILVGGDALNERLARGAGFSDVLFLLAGGLVVFAYFGFRQSLRERLNYRALDIPLLAVMLFTLLFHGMAFLQSLLAPMFSGEVNAALTLALWIPFMVIFGALDLIVAFMLLRDRKELPDLLAVFACIMLVLGLLEITVVFSFAAIALLPLALAVLGFYLVREPEFLEVI